MKIYFIPGLGFDNRIFQKLNLGGLDVQYVEWIEPLSSKESITSYATRLSSTIEENHEEIILVGHSFGGVISQEIAAIKKVHKIVLISSIKSRNELPFHFKLAAPLRFYKFFTKYLVTNTLNFWGNRHGYKTEEEKGLFIDMFNKQSNTYLQWAFKNLSEWKNPNTLPTTKIIQIHGDLDKTFPIILIDKPQIRIKNGDHFMVYKQPNIISEFLVKEISS